MTERKLKSLQFLYVRSAELKTGNCVQYLQRLYLIILRQNNSVGVILYKY